MYTVFLSRPQIIPLVTYKGTGKGPLKVCKGRLYKTCTLPFLVKRSPLSKVTFTLWKYIFKSPLFNFNDPISNMFKFSRSNFVQYIIYFRLWVLIKLQFSHSMQVCLLYCYFTMIQRQTLCNILEYVFF